MEISMEIRGQVFIGQSVSTNNNENGKFVFIHKIMFRWAKNLLLFCLESYLYFDRVSFTLHFPKILMEKKWYQNLKLKEKNTL